MRNILTAFLIAVPTMGHALDANDMPFMPISSSGPIEVISKNLHPDAMIVSAMSNISPSSATLSITVENVAFIPANIEVGCLIIAGEDPVHEMIGVATDVPEGASGTLMGEIPSNATGAACRVVSVEPA